MLILPSRLQKANIELRMQEAGAQARATVLNQQLRSRASLKTNFRVRVLPKIGRVIAAPAFNTGDSAPNHREPLVASWVAPRGLPCKVEWTL